MIIDAKNIEYQRLNRMVKDTDEDIVINNCIGQRYIASGLSNRKITINGTPGSALAAYLDGAEIMVHGNVQDATGDTMNDGMIIIHGDASDALGYAMRGGKIYVKGSAGYRTGIHMKEYKSKKPVIILGESAGSFLGEYLAGGIIIVLGLNCKGLSVGNFPGTGMHGGKIFLRGNKTPSNLPPQISKSQATQNDLEEIICYIKEFCNLFNIDYNKVMSEEFTVLRPDSRNPYHQLYVSN
ncbi:MAG: glutamate synthase [Christensenellaceae bacterium]|jgi:glutamate synthase domain-containing protein 3|nr:glutamate synthase [Christensenellaceae bacterium]